MTSPVGFVKSTNHAPGRATLGGELGELQHHRHRPQRLGEPAGTGRLLADAPEPRRDRLVPVAGLVPAHPELHDHEVGAVDRLDAVVGEGEATRPAGPAHHALGQGADDVEPLSVDVEQHQLVHRETVTAGHESLDELRRVRAASTDDRDLHTHAVGIVHSRR